MKLWANVRPGGTYIYIGWRLGVPQKPIAFYLYGYGKCWFYTGLQCFMLFSQLVRSVKVAMSARINLTFVRAENDKFTSSMDGQTCVQHRNQWNCGFMHFWSFCWQLENVIIHWRTMDEMNITPVSFSRPQRLYEAVAWSESTIGLLTVQSQ